MVPGAERPDDTVRGPMRNDGLCGVATWARGLVTSFLHDEAGQDLIEYALLTALLGVTAIATWPLVASAIGSAYRAMDANTQGLWEPPPPGGGP